MLVIPTQIQIAYTLHTHTQQTQRHMFLFLLFTRFYNHTLHSHHIVYILGIQVASILSWRDHITNIAKSASKKLGVLFRFREYFSASQLLKIYVGLIRPCLEYCSHIWGASPYTYLLDRVESKAIRLIGDASVTSSLDSLSLRRKVASLSLFYKYYFGHCSVELAGCVPPPLARPLGTRQATSAHRCSVEICNPRIDRFSDCFFHSTSVLWNSLPDSVFLNSYNLSTIKRFIYNFQFAINY